MEQWWNTASSGGTQPAVEERTSLPTVRITEHSSAGKASQLQLPSFKNAPASLNSEPILEDPALGYWT